MFSSPMMGFRRSCVVAGASVLLASCGGGDGGSAATPVGTKHTVGGTVSGLAGSVILQNNAGDELKLTADGRFTFASALSEGAAYEVSVRTQPLWQFCTVTKGSGKASADVADVAVACSAAQAEVSLFAGSGAAGSATGIGSAASFSLPYGIIFDKNGNLFVSDVQTGILRKITPAGETTNIAGGGISSGPVDGNGAAAYFDGLGGIALDAAGNIYATELSGNRIRKITPGGLVTTFAGSGTTGSADGPGNTASFNSPGGVALDGDGNVYVADTGNNLLRRITRAGVVSTLAGQAGVTGAQNGIGSAARFKQPYGVVVDADGTVYVADTFNNLIRKVVPVQAP